VKGPGPFSVSTRPAAVTAATKVLKLPAACAVTTMSLVTGVVLSLVDSDPQPASGATTDTANRERVARLKEPLLSDDIGLPPGVLWVTSGRTHQGHKRLQRNRSAAVACPRRLRHPMGNRGAVVARRPWVLPIAGLARMTETTINGPESDDALMALFMRGDEVAFAKLYDRYAPPLSLFLRRFVRDQTLAEDLLQTTFLSFVRARGRYVATTGVRAWLYSIAANAGRDALRRRRARREEPLDFEVTSPEVTAPEWTLSDPHIARALDEALHKLPTDQREAVLLHKLHGLSFPEVASALGTSVGAAKVRAHRGYQRLRVLLAAWETP